MLFAHLICCFGNLDDASQPTGWEEPILEGYQTARPFFNMFDFFLSHNRAEKDWTRKLAETLRSCGAKVFFDEDSIRVGDDIVAVISRALQDSKHIALILSPKSVMSHWVELEWASTLCADPGAVSKRILPIVIADCEVPFVLKRLHHLDACDLSISECANALMGSLECHRASTVPLVPLRSKVSTRSPVGFADNYLERPVDNLATRAITSGRAAYVYGPRRIGKTSLLRRQLSRAHLCGIPAVWIDLSTVRNRQDVEQSFYREIIRRFNPASSTVSRDTDLLSLRHHAIDNLQEAADASESKKILLLLDEMDAAWSSSTAEAFSHSLREMLANPFTAYLQCAAVGYHPPWVWQDDSVTSPWWNNFSVIPMTHFDELQIVAFLAGYGVDEESARALYEYTGGNPPQIMDAVTAIENGHALRDLLKDPMSTSGPLVSWVEWMCYSAKKFIFANRNLARNLSRGEMINSRSDRLAMWLHGLTKDPDSNPPRPLGSQVYEVLRACDISH